MERFKELRPPLRTCDAALSEAFFLLQQTRTGIEPLVALLERRLVVADFVLDAELSSIARLLRRYKDVPMSLADACLVRMSELLVESAMFTLDSVSSSLASTEGTPSRSFTPIEPLPSCLLKPSPSVSAESGGCRAAGLRVKRFEVVSSSVPPPPCQDQEDFNDAQRAP